MVSPGITHVSKPNNVLPQANIPLALVSESMLLRQNLGLLAQVVEHTRRDTGNKVDCMVHKFDRILAHLESPSIASDAPTSLALGMKDEKIGLLEHVLERRGLEMKQKDMEIGKRIAELQKMVEEVQKKDEDIKRAYLAGAGELMDGQPPWAKSSSHMVWLEGIVLRRDGGQVKVENVGEVTAQADTAIRTHIGVLTDLPDDKVASILTKVLKAHNIAHNIDTFRKYDSFIHPHMPLMRSILERNVSNLSPAMDEMGTALAERNEVRERVLKYLGKKEREEKEKEGLKRDMEKFGAEDDIKDVAGAVGKVEMELTADGEFGGAGEVDLIDL